MQNEYTVQNDGKAPDAQRAKSIRIIKYFLFSASIVPVIIVGAMAYRFEYFEWTTFLLVLLGLFLGQAAGDYLYFYFTNFHTDKRDSHTKIFAGWSPLFIGKIFPEKSSLYLGIACLAIDLAIGIFFFLKLGWFVLALAVLGGLVAVFFTPLMIRGFKELVIFFTFGPLIIFSSYFAMVGDKDLYPLRISIPVAFFVTVVAYLKGAHFQTVRDGSDEVIINLSPRRIRDMYIAGYAFLVINVAAKLIPPMCLSGLLTLPLAWMVVKSVGRVPARVNDYLKAVILSLVVFIATGLLIAFGHIFGAYTVQ